MAYIGKVKDDNGDVMYPQTQTKAIVDWTPLNVSAPSTLGLAYLNASYDIWANSTSYRTIELPDARIVALSVHVSSSQTIDSSNNHRLAVLSVPTNIRPLYSTTVVQGATAGDGTFAEFTITLTADGIVQVTIPQNVTTDHVAGYHAEFFYLAKK